METLVIEIIILNFVMKFLEYNNISMFIYSLLF